VSQTDGSPGGRDLPMLPACRQEGIPHPAYKDVLDSIISLINEGYTEHNKPLISGCMRTSCPPSIDSEEAREEEEARPMSKWSENLTSKLSLLSLGPGC
jgi:hypothetical protein